MRADLIFMVLILSGCATTKPPEVMTKPDECEKQGGCVVIGKAAVVGLMSQAWDKGGESGFKAGQNSCRNDKAL